MARPHVLGCRSYTDFLNHALTKHGELKVSLELRRKPKIRILILASLDKNSKTETQSTWDLISLLSTGLSFDWT